MMSAPSTTAKAGDAPNKPSPESAAIFGQSLSVALRLADGQQFNAFETVRPGVFVVGIGPITDFLTLASASKPEVADVLVASLRMSAGQPAAVATLMSMIGAPV